jgi:hypothetical protein
VHVLPPTAKSARVIQNVLATVAEGKPQLLFSGLTQLSDFYHKAYRDGVIEAQ